MRWNKCYLSWFNICIYNWFSRCRIIICYLNLSIKFGLHNDINFFIKTQLLSLYHDIPFISMLLKKFLININLVLTIKVRMLYIWNWKVPGVLSIIFLHWIYIYHYITHSIWTFGLVRFTCPLLNLSVCNLVLLYTKCVSLLCESTIIIIWFNFATWINRILVIYQALRISLSDALLTRKIKYSCIDAWYNAY